MRWGLGWSLRLEAPFAKFPAEQSLFLSHFRGKSSAVKAEYHSNADSNWQPGRILFIQRMGVTTTASLTHTPSVCWNYSFVGFSPRVNFFHYFWPWSQFLHKICLENLTELMNVLHMIRFSLLLSLLELWRL